MQSDVLCERQNGDVLNTCMCMFMFPSTLGGRVVVNRQDRGGNGPQGVGKRFPRRVF